MKLALGALLGGLFAIAPVTAQDQAAKDRKIPDSISVETLEFRAGTIHSKSYLALPKKPGPHPGILVVHEWWGLNDTMKMRAEMLAELGYAALAVDLFGNGEVAFDPPAAGRLEFRLMGRRAELHARFTGAMKALRKRPEVDEERIAAIGYGTGGDVVLQMARNGAVGLDGVAAFHPFFKVHPPNPPINKPPARILVCNAGEDPYVKLSKIARFKNMMKECQAKMQFVNFPTAMQSFTVPGASKIGEKFNIPHVYSKADDVASWKVLLKFLDELWVPEGEVE